MRVLLIGNSHTYFNDMPWMLAQLCRSNRIETDVTMLAHGGKGLDFHVKEPEVRFNICYGGYDAVVLQHTAHPMGELKAMENAAVQLSDWITAAGSLPVLYMTWTARRDGFAAQPAMSRVYRELGRKLHCPVAPVGEVWWRYGRMAGEESLYAPDGEHASSVGSLLAAYTIARTVLGSLGQDSELVIPVDRFPAADSSTVRQICLASKEAFKAERRQDMETGEDGYGGHGFLSEGSSSLPHDPTR